MTNSKRVILSLTENDINQLTILLHNACSAIYGIAIYDTCDPSFEKYQTLKQSAETWNQRFHRIQEHLTDVIPIHFTDLGTEN